MEFSMILCSECLKNKAEFICKQNHDHKLCTIHKTRHNSRFPNHIQIPLSKIIPDYQQLLQELNKNLKNCREKILKTTSNLINSIKSLSQEILSQLTYQGIDIKERIQKFASKVTIKDYINNLYFNESADIYFNDFKDYAKKFFSIEIVKFIQPKYQIEVEGESESDSNEEIKINNKGVSFVMLIKFKKAFESGIIKLDKKCPNLIKQQPPMKKNEERRNFSHENYPIIRNHSPLFSEVFHQRLSRFSPAGNKIQINLMGEKNIFDFNSSSITSRD